MKSPKVNTSVKLGSPTPWFIAASIALVFALGMAAITARFVGRSTVVTGTVTGLSEASGDHGTTFAPEYSFTTQEGRAYNGISSSGSNPPAYAVGETIRVRYDKAFPSNNKIDTFWSLWGFSILFALAGGFFAVLGQVMRAAKRRKAQAPSIAAK